MPNLDINQLATNTFGLSASGYVGSQGPVGYIGSAGANGAAGADGTGSNKPKIANIQVTTSSYTVLDDTAVDTAGGYIKISGTGFVSGCNVLINQTTATSVTFVSATEIRVQLPATTAGTYMVYVVNPDGAVALRPAGVTFSATPTWVTATTLTPATSDVAYSNQLTATGATVYALAAGNALPTGMTLSANGLISGSSTVSSSTTYSFTVIAADNELQDSPRTFSLDVSLITNGQQAYTTPGTYSWTAPAGITSVSVVCVGAGGGTCYSGGGGGGLGWKNNISVTPGQSYTVVVGAGGTGTTGANDTTATSGGDSYFINATTVKGGGGGRGRYFTSGVFSVSGTAGTWVGDGGGNGGIGGEGRDAYGGAASGGAGGYSGNGGAGGMATGSLDYPGVAGAGGGGGGGGADGYFGGGGGGGVGIFGEGASGTAGAIGPRNFATPGKCGTAGSGGTPATSTNTLQGGQYGGGGSVNGQSAGGGAVRIIWGINRAFPSTNTVNL
jgi:hypothetical protein